MIPFSELCTALDRFNRRRRGNAAPRMGEDAHGEAILFSAQSGDDAQAEAGDDEEMLAAGGELEQELSISDGLVIESSRPLHEDPTGEIDLEEIHEVVSLDVDDGADAS